MRSAVTQGLLFVIEGADGVGKSSTIRAVAQHLRSLEIRHSVLTFPGREAGTLGKVIYDIHHGSDRFDIEAMSEAAKQTLHIAAHLDAIERKIIPLLKSGEHVLLDRYWWSTWVYGIVGGVSTDLLDALIQAERIQWGSMRPSLVIVLDRDNPVARDEDITVWRRIRTEYLALASKEEVHYPVQIVRNTATVEKAAKRILDLAVPIILG